MAEQDYEDDGRVSAYRELGGFGTYSTTYTHDWAHQLKTEVRTGSPANFNNTYNYDKNGNRTSVVRNGQTYTYGAPNANDQFTTGEGFAFTNYDNNGNARAITVPGGPPDNLVLTYDMESQVTQITHSNGQPTETFTYNADWMRVEKQVGIAKTRFIYDGSTVIAEFANDIEGTQTYHTPGVGWVNPLGPHGFYRENMLGSTASVMMKRRVSRPGAAAVQIRIRRLWQCDDPSRAAVHAV